MPSPHLLPAAPLPPLTFNAPRPATKWPLLRLLMLLLCLLPVAALAVGQETPPIRPSDPPQPATKQDAAFVAPDAGTAPRRASPADAGAPAPALTAAPAPLERESKEEETSPPSTRAPALCEELRKAAGARATSKAKLDEERKALAAERVKLEALAADVARAREALKTETERLEALLDSRPAASPVLSRPSAPQPAPLTATAGASPNIASLAKSLKTMKGPQAAALITRMDGHLAAQVLAQMSPRDSGAVLGSLKPELAAELMTSIANLQPAETKKKDK